MKKILYTFLCAAAALTLGSCAQSYLETTSPSDVDKDFVFSNIETSRAAMYGVYEAWRNAASTNVFGDGLYYALDVAGSDIEHHPEKYSAQGPRHYPEGLYENGTYTGSYTLGTYDKDDGTAAYDKLYAVIGKANAVISAMEDSEAYEEFMAAGQPSALSQLYGEAICARVVSYRELIKYYGDVPYTTVAGQGASGLAPRDSIYDCLIADLERVIPVMYSVGENSDMEKNIFSSTFANGMLGRICLDAAGYQTRRGDFLAAGFYKDGAGNSLTFETLGSPNANAGNAEYGRRNDWRTLTEKAKNAFKAVIDNPGSAKFYQTDPRANGDKVYDNPYQYFFQQMNDLTFADESVYEYAQTQGTGNDSRPYSFGRPSAGGGSNAFPCKNYGQGRVNPAYYWGVFDPQDKRRDVSIAVTGSAGTGSEKLLPFVPGSTTNGGGLSLNKWDENRMSRPYVEKQRTSGINGPYMRMAEMYLGYAEACALTGDDAAARSALATVRERSFPAGKANTDAFIASCGSVFRAVIEERGFEYASEGDRRWTLIRTGLLPEKIKEIKELSNKMMDGIDAQGYYEFENGNVISAFVWTKLVDAKALVGHRLTTQTPEGLDKDSDEYAVLYPGWRGQNDDWAAVAAAAGISTSALTAGDKTNLAIKGLLDLYLPKTVSIIESTTAQKKDGDKEDPKPVTTTRTVSPASYLELVKLVQTMTKETKEWNDDEKNTSTKSFEIQDENGYTCVSYGLELLENREEWVDYHFYKYDYVSAPIYLMPFNPIPMSTGGFDNGYGFSQN